MQYFFYQLQKPLQNFWLANRVKFLQITCKNKIHWRVSTSILIISKILWWINTFIHWQYSSLCLYRHPTLGTVHASLRLWFSFIDTRESFCSNLWKLWKCPKSNNAAATSLWIWNEMWRGYCEGPGLRVTVAIVPIECQRGDN